MRVIIIGSSGLIGKNFYKYLKEKNYNVIGTYNKNKNVKSYIKFDLKKDDITKKIKNLNQKDTIVIFSAYANPGWISENQKEASLVNIESTKKLINKINKKNCKIIFMSSVEVFNGKKKKYFENDKPKPLNFYGKSKLEIEKYIKNNVKNYIIFRTSWNSDTRIGHRCVIGLTYNTIMSKNAKMAHDNIFSITYVNDLCRMIEKYINLNRKIIHIANPETISRYLLATKIKINSKNNFKMAFKKCRFKDIKYKEPRGLKNILYSKVLNFKDINSFKKIDEIISKKVKILDRVN